MRSINVISNPHGCGLLTMSLSNKTLQENNMNIHLGGYQQICHISIWLTKLETGLLTVSCTESFQLCLHK